MGDLAVPQRSVAEVATTLKDVGATVAVCVVGADTHLLSASLAGLLDALALDLIVEVDVTFVLDVPSAEVVVYIGTRHVSPVC